MRPLFDAQLQASRAQPDVPLPQRLDRLRRIRALIDTQGASLAEAVQADFGVRSVRLTDIADFFVLRSMVGDLEHHTAAWMKPRRVRTPLTLQPARAQILRQPLGVVGVIGPWNYPLQLTLGPLATALAAGNRVMLKPSELTPRTSARLAELLHQAFAADEVCVVQGGPDVAHDFAHLPFDHLFFTGSTTVGRKVAAAAAANLTPTTLELGGKSPCIIDPSANLEAAALAIAHGKLLNGGQTCIAPDYVFLPQGQEAAFETAFRAAVQRLFPALPGDADYASIVSDRHHARLQDLLAQAAAQGARVVRFGAVGEGHARQMPPALVFSPPTDGRLMQEEIFGPLLPVLTYSAIGDVTAFINQRARPLALYWFGRDDAVRDQVLRQTVSGGVTVNDTLLHIAHENLPFGGVGESGWGSYHGEAGFLRFTHQKPVLLQSRWTLTGLFHPPYGATFDRMMGLLRRWL